MASLTNVTFPEQDYEILREAVEYYRYQSVSAFFRTAGRVLIDHYQNEAELVSPLQFAVVGEHRKPRRVMASSQ